MPLRAWLLRCQSLPEYGMELTVILVLSHSYNSHKHRETWEGSTGEMWTSPG